MDQFDRILDEIADPLARYRALTVAGGKAAAVVLRIAEARGAAVRQMHDDGRSYGEIGELIGLTRQRAYQLAMLSTSRPCDDRVTDV